LPDRQQSEPPQCEAPATLRRGCADRNDLASATASVFKEPGRRREIGTWRAGRGARGRRDHHAAGRADRSGAGLPGSALRRSSRRSRDPLESPWPSRTGRSS